MMQGIDGIIKFQKKEKLDEQRYSGLNEQVNIVEELLESAGLDTPIKLGLMKMNSMG